MREADSDELDDDSDVDTEQDDDIDAGPAGRSGEGRAAGGGLGMVRLPPLGSGSDTQPSVRADLFQGGGGGRRAVPSTGRRARNALLPATLVGLLLGLVVAAAGFALISRQEPQYAATASLLVLPDQKAQPEIVASLYDSLSSGQVVESYRAVMSSTGFSDSALDALRLSPRDRDGVVLDVHVVPSTALIDATVTARSPQVAERVADGLAGKATAELTRTFEPYRITSVSAAAGSAEKSGPSSKTLGGVVVLLAIVAVVVGQQAMLFLVGSRERARARRRPQRTATIPAGRTST